MAHALRASMCRAPGLLHEYMGHERLEITIAFRKPAAHANSRHPARTEGL